MTAPAWPLAPALASADAGAGPRPIPPHGTVSRHKHHGCKCLPCADAYRTYQSAVRRRKAYGTWRPFSDAEPVREHVRWLMSQGVSIVRITQLAGVSHQCISHLLYGSSGRPPTRQMKRENAAAILAIRPTLDAYAPGAIIDATGTRRRLQALTAMGWPQSALAPHLDTHRRQVSYLMCAEHVTALTARNVRRVYDQLWNLDPLRCGVPPVSVKRARNMAARQGWAGPLAWDDDTIDAPAALPDTGDERNRPGATAAEIAWLLDAGETDIGVIAARVGVSVCAVQQAMGRAGMKRVAS